MKKIISLLLTLTCVFAFFACDDEEPTEAPCVVHADADKDGFCDSCDYPVSKVFCETCVDADENGICDVCGATLKQDGPAEKTALESFMEIVNASVPTEIITLTTHNVKGEDPLSGRYETTVYEDGFRFSYDYNWFAKPVAGADPNVFVENRKGEVYYYDGQYLVSFDGVWNGAIPIPDENTLKIKFDITEDKLDKDYFEISRDGKTFTANMTSEQAEEIFGIAVSADGDGVNITIVHDGANLRSISISYATDIMELVTIETSYSYDDVTSPFGDGAENE